MANNGVVKGAAGFNDQGQTYWHADFSTLKMEAMRSS
jgi:hypothetical protein